MKKRMSKAALVLISILVGTSVRSQQNKLNTARLEEMTGLKGTLNKEEGVFKVTAPRNDVKIGVDGWTMPTFMGLTSWAAFKEGMKEDLMVMGDLVLFQDEVN